MAENIPRARLVVLPGTDHIAVLSDSGAGVLPVEAVAQIRGGLSRWLMDYADSIAKQINETGKIDEASRNTLLDGLKEFMATFAPESGTGAR